MSKVAKIMHLDLSPRNLLVTDAIQDDKRFLVKVAGKFNEIS